MKPSKATTQATPAVALPTACAISECAPVKGLTDNPAYQWWERLDSPEPDSWWGASQTPQSLDAQVALMRQLGVRVFRVELVWPFVASHMPGRAMYDSAQARDPNWSGYNWQRWDEIVHILTEAGIQPVPMVVYTPAWAADTALAHPVEPNTPPASAKYYADFLAAAVTRYRGSIHYWELWNEPDNADHTWRGTMGQYVELIMKPGYESIKLIDSTAQVLLGGLADGTSMKAVYMAGGKPYFDIANFHSYDTAWQGVATGLEYTLSAMHAYGDDGKPVWLSEFGMMTQPPLIPSSPGSGTSAKDMTSGDDSGQANLIIGVFTHLKVQAIAYYQLHDTAVYGPGTDIKKYVYWGLVNADLAEKKPGYAAYQLSVGGPLA